MSIQSLVTYDVAGNFTFDTDKIEISGGLARLKLQSGAQSFNEDFASDAGFTYDSGKSEFTGGKVQQKAQLETGETFRARYGTSVNADYAAGSTTGTATGGAVAAGGKLNLKGGTKKYVDYAGALNADSGQVGSVRFKVTPNYTGPPPTDTQFFFSMSQAEGSSNNHIAVGQDAVSGNIRVTFHDSAGTSYALLLGAWNPTSGVEYEFELNWDLNAGERRLFIDGVQKGSTGTGTFTRTDTGLLRIGNGAHIVGGSTSFESDFEIDDLQIFSSVQHTANYTPSVMSDLYVADTITLPQFAHTNLGTILSFTSFVTTEGGTPRYTLRVDGGSYYYWTGSAWATSDGTYTQANTKANITANIGTFPGASTATTATVRIHTTTGVSASDQTNVDDLTINYSGNTTYYQDNPTIIANAALNSDSLDGFAEVKSASGSDEVKYTLAVGGVDKWWDGAAWANSAGTYAEANTAAEIEANKAALDLSAGVTLKAKAFLHSNDGSTTPTLTSNTITYNYFGPSPTALSKCTVWGYVIDAHGNVIPGVGVAVKQVTATPTAASNFQMFEYTAQTTTTDANGYWEMEVVQSAQFTPPLTYDFSFTMPSGKVIRERGLTVPATDTAEYNDLV